MNNGYGGQASKFTFDHNYAFDINDHQADSHLDGSKAGENLIMPLFLSFYDMFMVCSRFL